MEKEKKEEHCQKWKLKIITKNIFTNKSKSTDKNQHFFCPMTPSTKTKQTKQTKTHSHKETMKTVC